MRLTLRTTCTTYPFQISLDEELDILKFLELKQMQLTAQTKKHGYRKCLVRKQSSVHHLTYFSCSGGINFQMPWGSGINELTSLSPQTLIDDPSIDRSIHPSIHRHPPTNQPTNQSTINQSTINQSINQYEKNKLSLHPITSLTKQIIRTKERINKIQQQTI